MRKKASLQLSINAIVVLILAITILGLGLGFIKKQFGSATRQFDVVDQEMRSSILDELRSSGDLITFKRSQFTVKGGTPETFYFGIRNTESSEACFFVQFVCDGRLGGDGNCNIGTETWDDGTNNWKWFSTFRYKKIPAQSSAAVLATLQAQGASDTYQGRMIIWKQSVSEGGECATDLNYNNNPPAAGLVKYGSKEFYITIE